MDWFERRILQYVVSCAPYNAMCDEDAFPEFGMRVDQLVRRFVEIVTAQREGGAHLAEEDRDLVSRARDLAARRSSRGSRPGPPILYAGRRAPAPAPR
jgi:hypothetical protein